VRLVKGGQDAAVTARVLGIPKATLGNWIRAGDKGELRDAGDKPVSPEQMELARLRAELARAKMERDILKKGDGVLREGVTVKYAWIDKLKTVWPVTLMCEVLGVSVSGFFEHRQRAGKAPPAGPGPRRVSTEALVTQIRAIHAEFKGEYGWPRVWKELLARGVRVGKDRVQRLMKLHGIRARGKRKFVVTTDTKHSLPVAENLLARDFTPEAPDRVWSSDITYIDTDEGWLYLAVVIDLFSRQVVGWSMQPHMQTSLVTDALRMAWFRRHPKPGLIF
jgi:putative transposase